MDDDDPDRAAILARRQRFIALALSGLATTACEGALPRACLDVARPSDDGANEGAGDEGSTGKPMPCLEVVAPDSPPDEDDGAPPQACLKIAAPDPEPEPIKPPPQPCLKIAAPEPEPEPTPQPCLRVAAPDPEPTKPRPHACLKIAKPKGT